MLFDDWGIDCGENASSSNNGQLYRLTNKTISAIISTVNKEIK